MAHNIHQRTDGTWAAYYAGKPAWHGLGTVAAEHLTPRQAYEQVFRKRVISTVPAFAKIKGKFVEVADTRFTTDGETIFAPVGADYPVISDLTVLNLLYSITKSTRKRAALAAVFMLGNGARAVANLDLTKLLGEKALTVLRDKSAFDAWLLADWSHDAAGALSFLPGTKRADCNNMVNAARERAAGQGKLVRIIHSGGEQTMADQLREAERVLGFASSEIKASMKFLNQLAEIPLAKPDKWFADFAELVIPTPDDAGKRMVAAREETRATLTGLWASSKTLVGVPKSPYRGLQVVGEYADHYRSLRIASGPDNERAAAERRFRSAIEGPSAELKARAAELIRQEFEIGVKVPVKR